MNELQLGARYRDRITGFAGVATGLVQYISGCNQVLLVPAAKDGNELKSGEWFDVQRVEVVEGELIILDNGSTPGCDQPAPKR
jgi:hypothetical protein